MKIYLLLFIYLSQINRKTALWIWTISFCIELFFPANTSFASDRPDIRLRRTLYWFHDRHFHHSSICFVHSRYTCSRFEVVANHNVMSEINRVINNNIDIEISVSYISVSYFYFLLFIFIVISINCQNFLLERKNNIKKTDFCFSRKWIKTLNVFHT